MARTFYQRRRCRKTGTHIVVCPSRDEVCEEEAAENPWMTICEEHGSCVVHETLKIARDWAADPDWCEECQELMRDGTKKETPRHLQKNGMATQAACGEQMSELRTWNLSEVTCRRCRRTTQYQESNWYGDIGSPGRELERKHHAD